MLKCHKCIIAAPLVTQLGFGAALTRKTSSEKAKLVHEMESTRSTTVSSIVGIALSICHYHKKFKKWSKVDFVSTPPSDFDSFIIQPKKLQFYSTF